jgi:putative hemolysin
LLLADLFKMATLLSEILIIVILVVINGLFAMSEIAILSARKARLQQWANEGNTRASAALELANAPNLFLSTVQTGITLIGILAGVFGGATLTEELAKYLHQRPLLAVYNKVIAGAIVVLGITYLSLVLGELVPKRLGLSYPERIAMAIAVPMRWLSVITSPIVRLFSASTELVLWILRASPSNEPPITEEEIQVLIEQGTQAGIFEEAEQEMVTGIFRLNDQRVSALMTPRTEIVWLDLNDSPETIARKITNSVYSRFPICQGTLDNVLGVVQVRDLLTSNLAGQSVDLTTIWQPPLYVPEGVLASRLLKLFKQSQTHIALVIDEYGGTQGLITLHDILEAIVGDMQPIKPQATKRQDGSWLLDGTLSADEFKRIFDVAYLPGERRGYYQTLAGFVMMHLGRIPSTGDHFEWGGLHLEVVDMDGPRIDKVLVIPL